jgi:hypothetical protein
MEFGTLLLRSAFANWTLTINRLNQRFSTLSPDDFFQAIAPGRNRIIYVLGHLTAVHDRTCEILGLDSRKHPDLDVAFIRNPDLAVEPIPGVTELLAAWEGVNDRLYSGMLTLGPTQWLERHQAVSQEDFRKDPTRTRFSVLLNRTNHAGYHLGQLMLFRKAQTQQSA